MKEAVLSGTTRKHSRQRDSILGYLASTDTHPTADMVYRKIRETYPQISLGTVYRNLALLAELGQIRTLSAGDGKEHFDGNTAPHDHFICRKCGKILDLAQQDVDYRELHFGGCGHPEAFSGTVERHDTIYYGLCGDCAEEAQP